MTGKIDRRELAALPAAACTPIEAAAPRLGTDTSGAVTALCARVLGVDRVRPQERFFDIGGNSLAMARLHALIEGHFGRRFPIHRFYEFPTIAALGAYVESEVAGGDARSRRLAEVRDRLDRRRRHKRPSRRGANLP